MDVTFNCEMCSYTAEAQLLLLKHVLKFHQNDPLFKVFCKYENCHASFVKWDSFRKHVNRCHHNVEINEFELMRPENAPIIDDPGKYKTRLV